MTTATWNIINNAKKNLYIYLIQSLYLTSSYLKPSNNNILVGDINNTNEYINWNITANVAFNAVFETTAVIVDKVKASETGVGFDANSEKYVDMKKSGIVDPTKVTRSALQNAASIASMVLTTESLVTDTPEPKGCNCGNHGAEGMPAGMEGMY